MSGVGVGSEITFGYHHKPSSLKPTLSALCSPLTPEVSSVLLH